MGRPEQGQISRRWHGCRARIQVGSILMPRARSFWHARARRQSSQACSCSGRDIGEVPHGLTLSWQPPFEWVPPEDLTDRATQILDCVLSMGGMSQSAALV